MIILGSLFFVLNVVSAAVSFMGGNYGVALFNIVVGALSLYALFEEAA